MDEIPTPAPTPAPITAPVGDGAIVYNHHGVILRRINKPQNVEEGGSASFISFVTSGSLNIRELGIDRWIEWIPEERALSVESESEWAMVNTVKPRSPPSHEEGLSKKIIRINFLELKSLENRRNNQKIYLNLKDGTIYDVIFQHGDALSFVASFHNFAILERSKRNRHKYYVQGCVNKELTRSFAELDLFREQGSFVVRFMKDLHEHPFETTLTAFSKLTGAVASGINGSLRPNPYPESYVPGFADSDIDASDEHSQTTPEPVDSPQYTRAPLSGDEYEVIGEEPFNPLPPRPIVTRGPPLSVEEWMRHVEEDGSINKVDELHKVIFRGGVEPELRYDVWKYLLGYLPYDQTQVMTVELRNQRISEYHTICQQWRSMSEGQEERFATFRDRKSLIIKDVNRTDRVHEYFAGDDNPHVDSLYNILMSYMMYNFDLGYVQGMSDLLSPILMLMNNEPDAFWCFVGFMDRVMGNFSLEQTSMKEQLMQLGCLVQVVDPQLASYLNTHESGNLFFCFRWLLVLFKREFSNDDIMVLWEVLWTGLPCRNFHLLLCLAILEIERETIMSNDNGLSDILAHVNSLAMHIDREAILTLAEAMYLQLESAASKLPIVVCETLGLPLPPVSKDLAESLSSPKIVVPRGASPHNTSDDDEAFELAISHSFL